MTMSPITYDEMRPGCYDPKARIDDMEMNWVDASLSFPTFPRFCGQTFLEAKDRELAHACVARVQRLDGRGVVRRQRRPPDPADHRPALGRRRSRRPRSRATRRAACTRCASARSRRSSACRRSTRGEWDPFFAACQETNTVVCMHIGSSSQMPATSADAPVAVAATLSFNNAMASLSDFLFSGVLVRFPDLKLAYSEGQIGWLPYVLERADDVWREHRAWGGVRELVPEPPSTYYYRQVYGCFFRDRHGLESLDASASTTSPSRPTTRTPTRRGPTRSRRRGHDGPSARRRRLQDRARQRDPHAVARPRILIAGRVARHERRFSAGRA